MSTTRRSLETEYITSYSSARIGGTGSAGTLPMTEEEMAKAERRPIGFDPPAEKPKRKRKPTSSG